MEYPPIAERRRDEWQRVVDAALRMADAESTDDAEWARAAQELRQACAAYAYAKARGLQA